LFKSYIEEMTAAVQGVAALVIGNRKAPDHFDLSQRGLVGSFIALLVILFAELLVGIATGRLAPGQTGPTVVQTILFYGAITLAPRVLLGAIGRADAFRPYLVALNWANFVFSIILLAVNLVGATPLFLVVVIAAFIASINVARIMMTLKPMQIVMLFAVQLIGFLIAFTVLLMLFPLSPEQLAEIAASSQQP
jgi:hypothetical protein